MNEKSNWKNYFSPLISIISRRLPCPRIKVVIFLINLVLSLILPMSEMTTHSKTYSDKMEEAILKLTTNQSVLMANHDALKTQLDHLISQMSTLESSSCTSLGRTSPR
ncbi:hypothetical protein V8G54_013443, partial [Vigna mungo]